MKISYGRVKSPVGSVGVGVSAKGICYVGLEGDVAAAIRRHYPKAELREDQKAVAFAAGVLRGWLESGEVGTPIDVSGTQFQQSVWKAMRRIPRGKTRSYKDIAKTIGKPKAVRAVGTACGANPVALLVPCHRVVGSNGGLGGYAWGLPMKKLLLALEGAAA